MVAEVLGFQPLEILVRRDTDSAPFLMDDIGEDGVFILFLDLVCSPIVGEFVAGFLSGHALLNPLFAATVFLPGSTGAGPMADRLRTVYGARNSQRSTPNVQLLTLKLQVAESRGTPAAVAARLRVRSSVASVAPRRMASSR